MQLNDMKKRLQRENIEIEIQDNVKEHLVKNGYDPQYGARPVSRIIRREILAGLSRYLLEQPEINQIEVKMDENIVEFYSTKKSQKAV